MPCPDTSGVMWKHVPAPTIAGRERKQQQKQGFTAALVSVAPQTSCDVNQSFPEVGEAERGLLFGSPVECDVRHFQGSVAAKEQAARCDIWSEVGLKYGCTLTDPRFCLQTSKSDPPPSGG